MTGTATDLGIEIHARFITPNSIIPPAASASTNRKCGFKRLDAVVFAGRRGWRMGLSSGRPSFRPARFRRLLPRCGLGGI